MRMITLVLLLGVLMSQCKSETHKQVTENDTQKVDSASKKPTKIVDILQQKEVPVLCYHHIIVGKSGELFVTPEEFKQQMQLLADSGYHSISPDQYYKYLTLADSLPSKPIMITFDDTDGEQYSIGAKELEKHGFRGVFFIMTISIGRPRYMTKEQLKELADNGHTIASHTWDHHKVTEYTPAQWDTQFVAPKKKLEEIIGKKVEYFAYPFGLWNEAAIPGLKQAGYKAAFQLFTKISKDEPLYTLRRMIVPGNWSAQGMLKAMKSTFHSSLAPSQ